MTTLGAELAARGHRVTVVGVSDVAPVVRHAGLGFLAVGRETHPPGHVARMSGRMAASRGLRGLTPVVRDMASMTDMLARELPAALALFEPDALVCDQLEAAGGIVARGLGIAHVSVANALPIDRSGDMAPFFTAWGPARSAWEKQRIRGAYRVADWMMRSHGDVVERHARAFGLGRLRSCAGCLSQAANVAQIVPELNYGVTASTRSDVGPFRHGRLRIVTREAGAVPLIYASLGTLFGGRLDVFTAVAEAAADLGVDVVIAHGERLSAHDVGRLVRLGARVVPWADQDQMLAEARVCVTHGGMNTALDAARRGVPMVAIPVAFDQPGIAARIEDAGLGLVAPPGWGLARRLRNAMARVLENTEFRARSEAVAARMATSGGVGRAADIVEAAVGQVGPRRDSDCAISPNGVPEPP